MQGHEKIQKSMFGTSPIEDLLPLDHPLRKIRALFDEAYSSLSSAFESSYGTTGNVSFSPSVLLRAHLLRALYSIKSERALCEQITMNAGFRWFVGLDWDDKVFDHSTLSFNRQRLFGSGAAEALFAQVCVLAKKKHLMDSDRLVVDGEPQMWAGLSCVALRSDHCADGARRSYEERVAKDGRSDVGRNQWYMVE